MARGTGWPSTQQGVAVFRGYVRVASHGEDPWGQIERLHAAGVEPGQARVDRSGGTRGPRPELATLLGDLRTGDVLVVTGLERLASSVLHLVAVGQRLRGARADLWSLDEALDTRSADAGLLDTLDVLADPPRGLTSRSPRAGLDAARSRGRRGGRPPRLDTDASAEARRLYDEGRSVTEIAERLRGARPTPERTPHPPSRPPLHRPGAGVARGPSPRSRPRPPAPGCRPCPRAACSPAGRRRPPSS